MAGLSDLREDRRKVLEAAEHGSDIAPCMTCSVSLRSWCHCSGQLQYQWKDRRWLWTPRRSCCTSRNLAGDPYQQSFQQTFLIKLGCLSEWIRASALSRGLFYSCNRHPMTHLSRSIHTVYSSQMYAFTRQGLGLIIIEFAEFSERFSFPLKCKSSWNFSRQERADTRKFNWFGTG